MPATPIPGTVLINLGRLMQRWTSDHYVATIHRVVIPEEEVRRRGVRQSIAFFVQPDNGVIVESVDGSVSNKYAPIEALEHLKLGLSERYRYEEADNSNP